MLTINRWITIAESGAKKGKLWLGDVKELCRFNASPDISSDRVYEVKKKESLIANGRSEMEEEGTKTGEEVQRETAQKSCRLKGWEEKGIEERCCNDAAVGTSPFPFSLFLPFSANFQSYNVGWKISIPRQWNSYLLLVISATIEECEPFSFFLLLFIRTCIALYFRLIEDRSMPISLPIGNRSSQFLRERIEGKESTCHVHRETKVAVARHELFMP